MVKIDPTSPEVQAACLRIGGQLVVEFRSRSKLNTNFLEPREANQIVSIAQSILAQLESTDTPPAA